LAAAEKTKNPAVPDRRNRRIKMRVAQNPKAGAPFEIVERPVPEPGARQA